jgi:DMSO/TMAO reductase YedYZ molybdopterin-dependent catalytic subunit
VSSPSRRDFLFATLAPAIAGLQPAPGGRLLGTIPFGVPGARRAPLNRLLGGGLDARLFTDLSTLGSPQSAIPSPQSALVTPNDRFYVRTAAPDHLRPRQGSSPPAGTEVSGIDFARLERSPGRTLVGPYLMECAGNADPANFGLMSVATWAGFPMPSVIDQLAGERAGRRVLVTGADPSVPSSTSVPGASWIFLRDQLERALLAVQMNDAPLPLDHGGPARLLVPGWYGCACIKWVNRIELVADDAPATSQMLEFAARTHQPFEASRASASPRASSRGDSPATAAARGAGPDTDTLRARDFHPAAIDTAAMPVRVEKWRVDGRLEYRITGIIWGGSTPTNALSIRFKSGGPWTRVENCPLPPSTLTWSLWTHTWRPEAPGRYQIVLRVDDPKIRTRRLDLFFYVREIEISEV